MRIPNWLRNNTSGIYGTGEYAIVESSMGQGYGDGDGDGYGDCVQYLGTPVSRRVFITSYFEFLFMGVEGM